MNDARPGPIDAGAPEYDAYVRAHPRATLYHRGAWARILARSYRFEPRYLALRDGGGVVRGVIPLVYKKGLVSDARVRSLPVFPAGGPLADTRDLEVKLLYAARDFVSGDADLLQIHSAVDYSADVPDLVTDTMPPRWHLRIDGDLDAVRAGWRKTSNNLYRSLRKADRADLVFREGTTDRDLRAFYGLYLHTMRKWRSLPRSMRQLKLTRELLDPGEFRVFVVEHRGRPAAAGVFHVFGGTVELMYNGSADEALELRPNHRLYWDVISWAAEQGHHTFDFGTAQPTSSLGRFKSQWAEPVEHYRYTWRRGGAGSRTESMAAASYGLEYGGGEGLAAAVWHRTPLQLTRIGATLAYRYL
jgi:hypothetical protein